MAPIRIAIIGGGIGGCTLANGLLKHENIEFDVFEGGAAFKEEGLAVGLAPNAQSALKHISTELYNTLRAAGGVPTSFPRLIMGEGPDKDAPVFDFELVNGTPGGDRSVVHVNRALFLGEMLKPIPEARKHANKRLTKIEQGGDILNLHFEDGSTGHYHAVVGSDGIRSTVRKIVLADHQDSIEPFFTGYWDVRSAIPMEAAKQAGIVDAANPSETGWMGNGGFALHQFMNNNELVGCIVAGVADETYDGAKWRNPTSREQLEKALGDRGAFGESIIKIMLDQPEPFAFSQYESAKAPTYYNGSICMMGDAAHAMTPWQGSGAGVSIEDAMILEHLLGIVTEPSQIPAAFKAYDEVRRPRTQAIVKSSREVGAAFVGRDPVMGMDIKKLSKGLPRMWDHIHGFDLDQHIEDALSAFERYKS